MGKTTLVMKNDVRDQPSQSAFIEVDLGLAFNWRLYVVVSHSEKT